jgi:hypothetical protein
MMWKMRVLFDCCLFSDALHNGFVTPFWSYIAFCNMFCDRTSLFKCLMQFLHLVLFLWNLHGNYASRLEQVLCNTKTLGQLSQQPQPSPYMFYGPPSPFNAAPSHVSFNAVPPGISFNPAPSSVAIKKFLPAVVCVCFCCYNLFANYVSSS